MGQTRQPTLDEVRAAIQRHRDGFAALAARRPQPGPNPEQAAVTAFDLALACFDNPWGVHGTTKKLVCDLVPGDHVLVLDRVSQHLVWRTVTDDGVTRVTTTEHGDGQPLDVYRVHFTDENAYLDVVSDNEAVTVDAATAYRGLFDHRQAAHVADGLIQVQQAMEAGA